MQRWNFICNLYLLHLRRSDYANIQNATTNVRNTTNLYSTNINSPANVSLNKSKEIDDHNSQSKSSSNSIELKIQTLPPAKHKMQPERKQWNEKEVHNGSVQDVDDAMNETINHVQFKRQNAHVRSVLLQNSKDGKRSGCDVCRENVNAISRSRKMQIPSSLLDMSKLIRQDKVKTEQYKCNAKARTSSSSSSSVPSSFSSSSSSSSLEEEAQIKKPCYYTPPWSHNSIALSAELKSYDILNETDSDVNYIDLLHSSNVESADAACTTLEEFEEMLFAQQPAHESVIKPMTRECVSNIQSNEIGENYNNNNNNNSNIENNDKMECCGDDDNDFDVASQVVMKINDDGNHNNIVIKRGNGEKLTANYTNTSDKTINDDYMNEKVVVQCVQSSSSTPTHKTQLAYSEGSEMRSNTDLILPNDNNTRSAYDMASCKQENNSTDNAENAMRTRESNNINDNKDVTNNNQLKYESQESVQFTKNSVLVDAHMETKSQINTIDREPNEYKQEVSFDYKADLVKLTEMRRDHRQLGNYSINTLISWTKKMYVKLCTCLSNVQSSSKSNK